MTTPVNAADHPDTIFVIGGAPLSGKSTVRTLLSQYTELPGGSCSDIIYEFYAMTHGITVAAARALPKEPIRAELVDIGNEFCKDDPAFLVVELYLRGVRIIDGVRRRAEWDAVQAEFNVIGAYVLNSRAPDIEDNTELTLSDFDWWIPNGGTVSQLSIAVKCFADQNVRAWFSPEPFQRG